MSQVVIVGAGIVGAACAYYAARAGLDVAVLERGPVAGGSTSHGEGNLLVSDKGAGPELALAQDSRRLWLSLREELGEAYEFEEKGGLVVASTDSSLEGLHRFAAGQREAGVTAEVVDDPRRLEPHLGEHVLGGVYYPEDAQCQPVLAAQAFLLGAKANGARLGQGEPSGVELDPGGAVRGVRTRSGERLPASAVVNAAGAWGGDVGGRLGAPVTILPRRGFVLVTEPGPHRVRHKVYTADYIDNVASSEAGLETSVVVEGTQGGTILIGASRERVGFDPALNPLVLQRLAAGAARLFPFLADVRVMRVYRGFRPYCPDHLPVIGPDPRVPGVIHACGHEGAGIGLAPATGALVTAYLLGTGVEGVEAAPYAALLPDRLLGEGATT